MSYSNGALAERNERVKYAKSIGVEKPHTLKKDALEEAIAVAEQAIATEREERAKLKTADDPFDPINPDIEGDHLEDALPEPTTVGEAVSLRDSIREAWLIDASKELDALFRQSGYPQVDETKVLISTGFPQGNVRKIIGQCHHAAFNDGIAHLFISPVLDDSLKVLATLAHEKAHSIGFTGHTGDFRKCAIAIGLTGCGGKTGKGFTSTVVHEDFTTIYQDIVDKLGPYPHTKVNLAGPAVKKQTTRMLKATCTGRDVEDSESGYTEREECPLSGFNENTGKMEQYVIRISKRWAEVGLPNCPCGGEMQLEEQEEKPDGE